MQDDQMFDWWKSNTSPKHPVLKDVSGELIEQQLHCSGTGPDVFVVDCHGNIKYGKTVNMTQTVYDQLKPIIDAAVKDPTCASVSGSVQSPRFDDAMGNNNNKIEPGERLQIWANLNNTGAQTLSGIQAQVTSSDSSYVRVESASMRWPDVQPKTSVQNQAPAIVSVAAQTPAGFTFTLHISATIGSDQSGVDLPLTVVAAPSQGFVVEKLELNDTLGNGNGAWEPGEKLQVEVTIRNTGTAMLPGGRALVSVSDPKLASVETAKLVWDDLASGASAKSRQPAVMTVAADAPDGAVFKVKAMVSAGGQDVAAEQDVKVTAANPGGVHKYIGEGLPMNTVSQATVSSPVHVVGPDWSGGVKIGKARLIFQVKHAYIGDLVISLVAPNGTVFNMYTGSGGGNYVQYDQDISATLKDFPAEGDWKLSVQDRYPMDDGVFESFELDLTPAVRVVE